MTQQTKKKHKFINRGAAHYELNPNFQPDPERNDNTLNPDRLIKIDNGVTFESPRELDVIFANKFERIHEAVPVVVTEERKVLVNQLILQGAWQEDDREFLESLTEEGFNRITRQALQHTESPKKTSSLGIDVTHEFQQAYDNGLTVWRNQTGKHQITKKSNLKSLNPQALEQDKVEKFVEIYLKEK